MKTTQSQISPGTEVYPELYQDPKDFPPGEQEAIKLANEKARRLYRALRYLLMHDFGFTNLPLEPKDFPGNLNDREKAHYLAIHGLMLADNYDDPMLGKDRPVGDDIVTTDEAHAPIQIARRFADAVVAAVQEYTSRADLFTKVFGFLKEEGQSDADNSTNHRAALGTPV